MVKPKITVKLSNIFVLGLGFQSISHLGEDSKRHYTLYISFLFVELSVTLYRSYHE